VNRKPTHKHSAKKITPISNPPHQYDFSDWLQCKEAERFHLLVENSPFGLSVIDPKGHYKYVNRKFTDMFGYTLDDVPHGRQWLQKAYPDERMRKTALSAWVEDLRKNPRGEGPARVFEVTCKDGSQKTVNFRSVPMDTGERFVIYEDISERTHVEKALQESERRYRGVFENTGTAMVMFEPDMTISMVNSEFESLTGYSKKEVEARMKWGEFLVPEDQDKMKAYEKEGVATRERASTALELRLLDRQRKTKDILLKISTIPGTQQRIGSLIDMTDRKFAEKALRESEERYRQLVTHVPAGIYEVDFVNQKFVTVNDVMCEYTGYTREEFLSLGPFDILTEESKRHFIERMSRVFAGETVPETVEYKIRGKGDKEFWVILNAKYIYERGLPRGAAVVVHDITKRKQAELALRQSEEKYRLLVDHANDGIFIAQDERIKFPNPRTQDILGYSADELAEMPYRDLIHPDDRPILRQRRKMSSRGESASRTYALRVMTRSGEQIWAQISSVPITWEERPAALNFVRDITLQKKAEEDLKKSLDKLRKVTGATIQAMAQTVEVRDPYTAGHQRRVSDLARAIATRMGLSPEQVDGIRMAGVVHDIGKISVPAEILSKPGILTDLEFSLIKTHPRVGYDILKEIEFPWDIAQIVLQHHERLDGTGYPHGLSSRNILLEAKILAVADVVEAMASHRPYRPALGIEKALQEISDKKGRLYDTGVVDTCLRLFEDHVFEFR
jgi:PAS domain S-box-containing protein/putative nucleotidyltransferase with HDIG domain